MGTSSTSWKLEQRYVVEVPVTTTVWTEDPARASRRTRGGVASRLRPAGTPCARWPRWPRSCPRGVAALQVREGAVGPLVFEFAAVRVWAVRHRKPGPPIWLLVRRSLEAEPEVKYYVSNADAETPLGVLALVACTRRQVEEFFEDGKSYLGMAQYETRSWVGWHHHMTLVGLAHLFVTLTRAPQKKRPELTLDRTVRLLEAALEEPELSGSCDCAGGLPHPSKPGRQNIT